MSNNGAPKLTPGEFVIMTAGVLILIFSFLPWYHLDTGTAKTDVTAWGHGLFPVAALVPLAGAIMAIQIALDRVARVSMSRRVSDFTWEQVHLVLALLALVLVVCYAVVDKGIFSFGLGYYVIFVCSAGLVVGAVLLRQERRLRA
ncbi:MAG: hypothetical protein M3159_03740 [Actinomycetota bacterium]|nr:hypothetical protein [Actinomycetota bacterium]